MEKLNCIIVEDEPLAAEVLSDYISEVPYLELKHVYTDAIYALEGLGSDTDVIILDIHLPKLQGLDFIKTLTQPPKIILTTAYNEYAVEAFDLNVVDYLLKPISFQRFLKAAQKLINTEDQSNNDTLHQLAYSYFRVDRANVKICLQHITMVESIKDYIRIHTTDNSYITKYQLNKFITSFPDAHLVRIHKSTAVSKNHIESYTGNEVEINSKKFRIGRTYKANASAVFDNL